ncbi:MAG: hypothetical protein WC415_03185 [Patescibacteria group bacterium]
MALWVWFALAAFSFHQFDALAEGLFGMMILHFPSSVALPLLGDAAFHFLDGFVGLFTSADILLPQFLTVFTAGIIQYFFVGHLLGLIILFLKKKFGKQELEKNPEAVKETSSTNKVKKVKIFFLNFVYLIFSISIFSLVQDYFQEISRDFEMFKKMHPTSNLILCGSIVVFWLISFFLMYRTDKKAFKEDKWNLIYILIPLLIILITRIVIK